MKSAIAHLVLLLPIPFLGPRLGEAHEGLIIRDLDGIALNHPFVPLIAAGHQEDAKRRTIGQVRTARSDYHQGLPVGFACRPDRLPSHCEAENLPSSWPQFGQLDRPLEG